MAISLATKFLPYVDEKFKVESKASLVTNNDFDWTGAKTIKVYKVTTVGMNDYDRAGTGVNNSRYGDVKGLDATTEEFALAKDRSFTFAIDKLDTDESVRNVQAASALERQLREVVIPEVDSHVYSKMCTGAGTKPTAKALDATNIYTEILNASTVLDDAEVPETGRFILVTPTTYQMLKQSDSITSNTDIGAGMKIRGVVGEIDGMYVIKVPANRLPAKFGFLVGHPSATVAPTKLADYKIHQDPPGISGDLVEGRINYDAFVLDNKAKALYYQAIE